MLQVPIAANAVSLDTALFPAAEFSSLEHLTTAGSPLADAAFPAAAHATALPAAAGPGAGAAPAAGSALFSMAASFACVALIVAGLRKIWEWAWK